MKARYDYGLMIFMLNFSLVSVSSYREDKEASPMRLRAIIIIIGGSFFATVTCVCLRPVWIRENLQNLVANNMEKLGNFLQGYDGQLVDDKPFLQGNKSIFASKNNEETMCGGEAEMGMVAGGQRGRDRRGDRCGDRHRDLCLVGLVVLTWWPVSGFGGRRGNRHRDRHLVGLVVLTWWLVSKFGGWRLVGWVAMSLLDL
ncbi:hypothetical protein SO802_004819 [Lithocarpus litseifolius]|uniref:Uncharacterized protein n=1 Tax=Lithocarpus litseifolius TaxID=425828 RepID=A0AAW2DLZ0_9ROSI